MQPAWTPEREVDLETARERIAAVAPALAGLTVVPLGAGWDNTAYLVGGRVVFRFPRRAIAVPSMRAEIAVLPALRGRLPLAVPFPEYAGDDGGPWPFAGYAWLAGDAAAERALDDATCARAAGTLGAFLAALHALPVAPLRARGAPLDELRRLDVGLRLPRALERLAALAGAGRLTRFPEAGPREPERVRAALLASGRSARTPRADALVHGDLDSRHVLVDPAGAPCGVIDWGDVHVGDPALDLALAHTLLPESSRPAFLERYGPVDAGTWAAGRFRALAHSLTILDWAVATGNAALAAEAGRWLDRAATGD